MWIVFAFGSLSLHALESTVDKIALVSDKKLQYLPATFVRVLLFCLFTAFLGQVSSPGSLKIFLPWPIVAIGALCAASSIFYTQLLRRIEVTGYTILSYLAPAFYLIIDIFIVQAHISNLQALGILLLSCGGAMFVINPKGFRIKKEFTPLVLGMLIYNFIINASQYYAFKYYFHTGQINEVSFYFNVWGVALFVLFLGLVLHHQLGSVWKMWENNKPFLGKIAISKFFDAASALLWLHALALASVAQVNATEALYPLLMIGVIYIAQNIFKLTVEENFSKGHVRLKLAGVTLLLIGTLFVK